MGRRIRMAREMKGMSQEALAKAMSPSVTKQAISKYEKGLAIPGSAVMLAMSNALNVAIDYFFRQQTVSISKIAFNKKSNLNAPGVKAINEIVRDHVERYLEAVQVSRQHMSTLSAVWPKQVGDGQDIVAMVKELKQSWNIGECALGNVIEILEQNGVIVIEIDDNEGFQGLSGWVDDIYPIIVLNKSLNYESKRFTALHELGHILIASDHDAKQMEKLCNIFAGEMLISDERLKEILGAKVKELFIYELENIRDSYGISIDALLFKMRRLGVVSNTAYKSYLQKRSSDEILRSRVEQSSRAKAETSHKFVNMVLRALSLEAISSSKAAMLLNISMMNLRTMLTPLAE
ncbi:MAG: ImmA/IrrE family metallo-endopeptidase [Bacteroidaceae bacterium]|nr:ImmA/IrrE family metallo-endopeptidase [Bacteroidaceae bacterium]